MQSFSFRLNTIIISIMALILFLVGFYVAGLMEKVYVDTLANRLTREANIIATSIDTHKDVRAFAPTDLQRLVNRFSEAGNSRITIVGLDGTVLADSEASANRMDNHLNRPEIREALSNGRGQSLRFSHTINTEMIYVAHVIGFSEGHPRGIVRLGLAIVDINEFVHNLWYSLALGMGAALLLTVIVSLLVSRHITRPIVEITSVARKITQKKFDTRVHHMGVGEIGQLAYALNFMASSLESQMKEIKENEEKLSGVLNNMVSGVILIGESRRILLLNSAIEEFLGHSEKTLIGKLHIEAGLNFGLSQLIDHCFQTGEKIRDEVHIYYPQEKIVDANLAPYTTDHGEVKGVVVVLHDITAIRRLEKMRSEFVANVSHELKTPITSIKGFAETLLDGAMEDKDISRQFLEIIHTESERLHRLINDILDLSKIEKRLPHHLSEVDVGELIQVIYHNLEAKISKKRIDFICPSFRALTIEGDPDRLHQIIVNLIDNAISYTPEQGTIKVNLVDLGESIQLSVKDNGIGIPKAEIHRIFERFYRVDKGRARNSGGTGLGLAIVKHLVESHHGTIMVDSEEGNGSTFTIILPKVQP
ncbi:two-component system histidine kinase PnpS [Ammoniphilus sp. YIM 78166]|uniref:two-component system histidine kinase PnpS n=1 Tax=Ammoniphilus sp. YIM 78166 TaxID=1644106 RepID=UPI00106F7DB5|nr:ATP-binding protein [Ammoniphilus sp. YIM 78166]